MDNILHKKYKEVMLTPEQVSMFADIIMADEAIRKVFLKIGEMTQQAGKEEDEGMIGVTISDVARVVKINRKVQNRRGTYDMKYEYIDQKHAERVIAYLLVMSLCFYRPVAKSKLVNYSFRGKQVAAEIISRLRKNNESKGEIENVIHE